MTPDWVRRLIDAATSGVSALAQAAMERILWLYGVVVTVGIATRNGWSYLTRIATLWRDGTFRFAGKVYGTLWYIIHIRIPAFVGNAVDNVTRWVATIIAELDTRITGLVVYIRDWLWERIIEVVDFIGRLRDWAVRSVNEVWDTLTRVAELVFTLLTSPTRMAAWVAGALFQYIMLFIWTNIDALLDLFRARATQYAGLVALRIEQTLARFL